MANAEKPPKTPENPSTSPDDAAAKQALDSPGYGLIEEVRDLRGEDTTHYVIMPKWIIFHPEHGPVEVLIYAILASYADNETGECWPSQRTLLRDSGIKDRRTLLHALQNLSHTGAIVVAKANGYVNRYTLPDILDNRGNDPAQDEAKGNQGGN